jgi:tetratricopeptide (TPR) repeat protein
VGYYYQDAITAYSLGNLAKASDLFGKAAEASMTPPSSKVDTNAVYNSAFTALNAGNYARAKQYYNKCLDLGYTAEGSVFASLSNCALAEKDTTAAKQYLADGMKLYPDNANILTNLINLYIQMKEDPKKIVELLDEAKAQMPDNPSLYYVEGNILTGVKDFDGALKAYRKSIEIDPNYEWGYYGEGSLWLQKQAALVEEANALPVNAYKEYDAKMEEISQALKSAVPAFETCYAKAKDQALKDAAADFLKRVYFALRNEGDEYKAGYEKYNALSGSNE